MSDDRTAGESRVSESRLNELLGRCQEHRDKGNVLSPGDGIGTAPQARASDATSPGDAPTPDQDGSFTAFLAPRQAPNELGRLGKYRILKVLGHGGMGVVYQAEDSKLKRTVAIKAMLPIMAASTNSGKRFLREAQAMAAVKHDHVVTIYEVDEQHGVPFLAMEYLQGETLDQRLLRPAKLTLNEILRIGREIAEALAAAHATGLIHRDIKPSNIWLESPAPSSSSAGRVKILDFGLARALTKESSLTQQGAIVGTPAFMAPEQARAQQVDTRTDLFSLGVVLYSLCSGKSPFHGADAVTTLLNVTTHQPQALNKLNTALPRWFSDLVMQLLEKDPSRRIASAQEVVSTLSAHETQLEQRVAPAAKKPPRAARHPEPDATEQLQSPASLPKPRRRQPVLLAALVLLLLCGLVGGVLLAVVLLRTPEGDYVIETDDPDFFFQVNKQGGVTLEDRKTKRTYALKVVRSDKKKGEFELEVTDAEAGLSFKTTRFTIKRGEKVALSAWFERKRDPVSSGQDKVDDAWVKKVAAMPPEEQVEAVMAKLKELNPEFDGKKTYKIDGDVVTELQFLTDNVTDISPVKALMGLQRLDCGGTIPRNGRLGDLTPLKEMKLTSLGCSRTQVSNLTALKDMNLVSLSCEETQVSDLSPLNGSKLEVLSCSNSSVADLSPLAHMPLLVKLFINGTAVSDLSPLKNAKLNILEISATKVANLSPLKDLKLGELSLAATPVSDLKPLQDMKLGTLRIGHTNVEDLSPLKGMPLDILEIGGSKVTDLSPLIGMPIRSIGGDFKTERDFEILRSMKALELINHKSAKEYWKEVEDKK